LVTFEEVRVIAPRFPEARFAQLDRNKDGAVTRGELGAGAVAANASRPSFADMLFARADADRDGKVTYAELAAAAPDVRREDFARADENGDGQLSKEESRKAQRGKEQQAMVRLAQSADINEDQQVTFEELAAVAPAMTRERFAQMDRNGDGILTSEDRPDRPEAEIREARVDRDEGTRKIIEADGNGDGKVEFGELLAAKPGYPRETFDRHDVNKDGVVSAADLTKARF
jgi:Ca2+-binding EF-hand superfamily protein